MRLDWIFLPRENPCAKFYIIIIIIIIIIIVTIMIIIIIIIIKTLNNLYSARKIFFNDDKLTVNINTQQ